MEFIPLENLLGRTGSIYKLCILASRRAAELNNGSEQLVISKDNTKISIVALKEILEGKVKLKDEGKPKE